MKGCMGQRFCDAVVWITELLRVKKLEINLNKFHYFIFSSVELIFKNSLTKSLTKNLVEK